METVGSPFLWVGFTLLVLVLLALDLGVLNRQNDMGPRQALRMTLFWISLAVLFNVVIYFLFGTEKALEFTAGYLVEYSLSVDNIFVFLVVFSYFAVPHAHRRRVLFWGILGAITMRAAFILAGATLLKQFHWMIFVFGGFLILTGVKLFLQRDEEPHPERNILFRLFQRFVPSVSEYHGGHFLVRIDGRRFATPLLLVLVCIEATDVVFAIDSVPAIFAITRDPFIVYTSNIFAILGLRALYFLLADLMERLHYLKVGLSAVLVFVGVKMVLADWYKVPVGASLAIIAGILAVTVIASLRCSPGTTMTKRSNRPPT